MCVPTTTTTYARGVMTTTIENLVTQMRFPYPDALISLNDRMHYMKRARLVRTWREAVGWRAIDHARRERLTLPLPSAVVICRFVGARQRDASNLFPTAKSCVDGLVDAKWWSDDDDAHVSQAEPQIVRGPIPVAALGVVEVLVYAR